jgi:selenocysteine lyase/cysteine desulfurase
VALGFGVEGLGGQVEAVGGAKGFAHLFQLFAAGDLVLSVRIPVEGRVSTSDIIDPFALDELEAIRAETPGCEGRIHFNNAGAGLMPSSVLEETVGHLRLEAEIGGYEASAAREDAIADFYRLTATLLNCKPENVAHTANATDAYSRALSAIPFAPGDLIVTTRNDYISNQIAFLSMQHRLGVEVVHAPDASEGGVDLLEFESIVKTRRPRLVAVTHIPTSSGLVQPVEAIGSVCRDYETLYLVDACQSVGQRVVDVDQIGCDFLSATHRKFLRGARGSGFLFVSDAALRAGLEPLFVDMHGARWTAEQAYEPAPTARRFEDWEFAYALLLGSAEATRYALEVGVERAQARATRLAGRLRAGLDGLGLRVLERGPELGAIVTVEIPGWQSDSFKAALDAASVNSALSYREFAQYDFGDKRVDWCIRLSPHYYNTDEEVDRVVEIFDALADEGER